MTADDKKCGCGDEFTVLKEEIAKLKLEIVALKNEFNEMKIKESDTGIILDGAPDFVREYIEQDNEEVV